MLFNWNVCLPVKPVKNHQSHHVILKLSKPQSHIRNFPYLTKEINSIPSISKIQVSFLIFGKITTVKLKTALTQLLKIILYIIQNIINK